MKIDLLRARCLRNLNEFEIRPGPRMNIFFGRNGAGKTSVLEAIYLLGRGRTYRGPGTGPLIGEDCDSLEVFGRAKKEAGDAKAIGVWKNRKETRIKLNGAFIRKLSELARNLPLQMINTQSHDLFMRGPGIRRRFMDWGLFHVEHQYQQWFSRYRRLLDQRNASLKQGAKESAVWDEQLRENGEKIHEFREKYLAELVPILLETAGRFFDIGDLSVDYYPGWPVQNSYRGALSRSLSKDLQQGYTSVGIHKADLRLKLGNHSVEKILSRGQQKLLVSSLLLSQATLSKNSTGDAPLILFDDVSAELDKNNLDLLLDLIFEESFQVYVNFTEKLLGERLREMFPETRMFHVEHGAVSLIS